MLVAKYTGYLKRWDGGSSNPKIKLELQKNCTVREHLLLHQSFICGVWTCWLRQASWLCLGHFSEQSQPALPADPWDGSLKERDEKQHLGAPTSTSTSESRGGYLLRGWDAEGSLLILLCKAAELRWQSFSVEICIKIETDLTFLLELQ